MLLNSLRICLILIALLLSASCAHVNCAYDTKTHPNPISLTSEEGVFGMRYRACFMRDGIITEEYIPECAYKYYSNKKVW